MIELHEIKKTVSPAESAFIISDRERLQTQQEIKLEKIKLATFEPTISLLPKPKSSAELLIELADIAETVKNNLLKIELKEQKTLSESIIETQKKFQKILKEKREHASSMANYGYLERLISGLFSALSIGTGAVMASTLSPTLVIGGSFFILSGSLSLSAIGLESLGADPSITRPLSISGLAVGILATAIGGYLNPQLVKNSLVATLETSQVFFSGVCSIALGSSEKKIHELESDLTTQRHHQEVHRQQQEKIAIELSELVKKLNVSEQASNLLKQQQDLKNLYINSMLIQG